VTQHAELVLDAVKPYAGSRTAGGHARSTASGAREPQPIAGLTRLALSANGTTVALRARQRGQFAIRRYFAWILIPRPQRPQLNTAINGSLAHTPSTRWSTVRPRAAGTADDRLTAKATLRAR
jgi:hypothetical protein